MPSLTDPTILFYMNALTRLVFAADGIINVRYVQKMYRPAAVGTSLIISLM